jgi:NAD(P)-dependent dehydrogenase (short-subunit alcohol dehydrogenase family)
MHIPAPVSLVTGSAQGLGAEIASSFQERGDKVHVVWRGDEARGEDLEELYRGRAHHVDLSDREGTQCLVERLLEIDGKLDHVVHCVGDYLSAALEDTPPERWRELFESNVVTTLNLVDALREPMRETGGTLVLFACSGSAAVRGRRKVAAYAAAKSALLVLARSLALSEAPYGWRVNSVSPGLVPHPDAHSDTGDQRLHAQVPLGRAGTPQEVAAAVLWLSSSDSSYVVGVDLELSGGWGD